jgi:ubiquinone/menaquinone biosynthesis C-methylase UbiE
MPSRFKRVFALPLLLIAFAAVLQTRVAAQNPDHAPLYSTAANPSPDGTGKVFMGREIAQVMGHQGADWLERPERADEERPDKVVRLLGLKPGDRVADIGAGTGYFSRRLAAKVAPGGVVFAEEIQQEMLDLMNPKLRQEGVTNVQTVLGTVTDPKLPAGSIDLVIMVDVYHEFSHPYEMMEGITRALKTGGRVAFVEYKAEDPSVPIKLLHKMSEAQVKKEAAVHALEWVKTIDDLPRQHLIIFQKK